MSLNQPYEQDNIFAKIICGDIPCVKVHETDDVLCFMDVFPQSKGHCLVIHKQATATNLLDIEPDALSVLTAAVQKIARAVNDALKPDGIRIVQFNGATAGQTVFHLHFHVIPIFEGSALGAHGAGGDGPASAETLSPIAEKISAVL